MFGYVRVDAGELRVKEYAYYRSVYCGLCKSIKRRISPLLTLSLSYDFTFLALVRMTLSGIEGNMSPRRCAANPFKKRPMMDENDALAYSADASAILFYHKVRDNIVDERGCKRLLYRLLSVFAGHWYKKALRHGDYALLDETIRAQLSALSSLERTGETSPDAVAEPFGLLLGALFAHGYEGTTARIAENVGRHVGRFIYITDAIDDAPKDAKKGGYNPFVLMAKEDGRDASAWLDENSERLSDALTLACRDAYLAITLAPHWNGSATSMCTENILVNGMPKTAKAVLSHPGKALSGKDISL